MASSDITTWRVAGGRSLDLRRPAVMAILNVTPDSFSDGGELATSEAVVRRAARALEEGADILDIGGESTRPGADRVDAAEQIRRVVPAIEAILRGLGGAVVSVDTTLAEVAEAAIGAGAAIVNDVSGGSDDRAMHPLVARSGAGYIAMHRVLPPSRDSYSDRYSDAPIKQVVTDLVAGWMRSTLEACEQAGIDPACVVLDPGLGFGKTVEQNLELIRGTPTLCSVGRPILSGLSRKSFVGRVCLERDSEPGERGAGTVALTALHRAAGASVFRVHEVSPAVQAIRAADALARTAF